MPYNDAHVYFQMVELEKKFEKEITKDCTVLAARHPLPNWKALNVYGNGLESVWVYKHPDHSEFSVKTHPSDLNHLRGNNSNDTNSAEGNKSELDR